MIYDEPKYDILLRYCNFGSGAPNEKELIRPRRLFGWETVVWCGDLVTGGGTGLVGGEGGVRWKEPHRQDWAGLDWKSRSGLGDRHG